jgi:hypothetical protein
MSLARKTQAKYGAQIPAAPSTGAKQARPAKQRASADPSVKVEPGPEKAATRSVDPAPRGHR